MVLYSLVHGRIVHDLVHNINNPRYLIHIDLARLNECCSNYCRRDCLSSFIMLRSYWILLVYS